MIGGRETLERVTRAIQNCMVARRDRGVSRETSDAARAYATAALNAHLDVLEQKDILPKQLVIPAPPSQAHRHDSGGRAYWYEADVANLVGKGVRLEVDDHTYVGKVTASRPAGEIDDLFPRCTHICVEVSNWCMDERITE